MKLQPTYIMDTVPVEFADFLSIRINGQWRIVLIRGKRGVTPETAWLLAGAFKIKPQFWLNLQANYDLAAQLGVIHQVD